MASKALVKKLDIDLDWLISKVIEYCEAQSGVKLHPYQIELAEKIVESIILNDGEEITALFARQSGKTETIAMIMAGVMVIIPKLAQMDEFKEILGQYKDGIWIGLFAPSKEQAFTTFSRTRDRIRSKNAKLILGDPEISTTLEKIANPMVLSNGSFMQMHSAAKQSQIESKTYHVIILEECLPKGTKISTPKGYRNIEDIKSGDMVFAFDHSKGLVLPKKVERAFSQPIYSRKMVKIYLENGAILRCTDNHKVFTKENGYIRADGLQKHTIMFYMQKGVYGELRIKRIEIEEPTDHVVYDLTVEDCHNFFAENILVHNCQDIDRTKILKSVHPMGAATNATIIKVGTSNNKRCEFLETIRRNKRFDAKSRGGRRKHYEYDYRVVQKYNPKYKLFIQKEKQRIGEDSDEFRMSYCVAPETKILTSDLRHVRADSLKKGDKLVGFDEEKPKKYGQRKFKEAIVEDVGIIERPCYRIQLEDGTEVTCSEEHKWLVFTAGGRTYWKQTKDLVYSDTIYKVSDVWDEPEDSYKVGYIAAAFDGEGHISQVKGRISQIVFSQKDNIMMETVKSYLDDLGFNYFVHKDTNSDRLILGNGKYDLYKFLGTIRPKRILQNFNPNKLGTLRCVNYEKRGFRHPKVINKEFIGNRTVISIRTSTRTYVAEGLASHNCLEWLLERGMFLSPQMKENLYSNSLRHKLSSDKYCAVGIDVGKKTNSTVVTVAEVDFENAEKDELTGEELPIKKVINWLEIQGDDYESQYHEVIDFLKDYNVKCIYIDATAVGSALADRLVYAYEGIAEVVPYEFTTSSKSIMWKLWRREIENGRFLVPSHAKTTRLRTWKRFNQQIEDLEKEWKGQHLVCSKPKDDKNALDDYCDSGALCCMAAHHEVMPEAETEDNFLFGKRR